MREQENLKTLDFLGSGEDIDMIVTDLSIKKKFDMPKTDITLVTFAK